MKYHQRISLLLSDCVRFPSSTYLGIEVLSCERLATSGRIRVTIWPGAEPKKDWDSSISGNLFGVFISKVVRRRKLNCMRYDNSEYTVLESYVSRSIRGIFLPWHDARYGSDFFLITISEQGSGYPHLGTIVELENVSFRKLGMQKRFDPGSMKETTRVFPNSELSAFPAWLVTCNVVTLFRSQLVQDLGT